MYGYNYDNQSNMDNVNNQKKKNGIFPILLIIFIALLGLLFYKILAKSDKKYHEIEERLIESAKAYVINNNINTKNELYLDIATLKVSVDGDCSVTSGVIFDGRNYFPNLICNEYKSDISYNPSESNQETIKYRLIPSNQTVDDVTIILSINDNNFDYVKLPNGETKKDKYITYKVDENDIYIFNIYDINGNVKEQRIEVNNIEVIDYGTCIAKWKSDSTLINVTVKDEITVNTYEYIVNDKSEIINALSEYTSKTVKPQSVMVKIKTSEGKTGKIKCSIDEKAEPEIVTDEKGKNCLEGFTCYIQYDYQDSNHPYCSMQPDTHPNSCGGIGRNGCSITAASMAIANMGVKSSKGELYNPFTVHEELYNFNYDKKMGACWGGCSGWSKIKDSIVNAGLSATKALNLNKAAFEDIYAHLRNGYPVILHAAQGSYAMSNGHYLVLFAVRDDNAVYMSDPSNKSGIKNEASGSAVDTWVMLDTLVNGHIDNYMKVGPAGMF